MTRGVVYQAASLQQMPPLQHGWQRFSLLLSSRLFSDGEYTQWLALWPRVWGHSKALQLPSAAQIQENKLWEWPRCRRPLSWPWGQLLAYPSPTGNAMMSKRVWGVSAAGDAELKTCMRMPNYAHTSNSRNAWARQIFFEFGPDHMPDLLNHAFGLWGEAVPCLIPNHTSFTGQDGANIQARSTRKAHL